MAKRSLFQMELRLIGIFLVVVATTFRIPAMLSKPGDGEVSLWNC